MLNALNDDCLIEIFQYLNLPDQLTLWQCEPRFAEIIMQVWRQKCKVIFPFRLKDFRHVAELQTLLECICESVEELHLNCVTVEVLREWNTQKYPKLQRIRCHMANGKDHDEIIELIAQLFPKLKSLEMRSSTNGKNLWQLQQLTELQLNIALNYNTNYFQRTLRDLKQLKKLSISFDIYPLDTLIFYRCVTLEEIKITGDVDYREITRQLVRLPRLKKITLGRPGKYLLSEILDCISYTRNHDVVELSICVWNEVDFAIFKYLRKLTHLRRLELSITLSASGALDLQLVHLLKRTNLFAELNLYFDNNNAVLDLMQLINIISFCHNVHVLRINCNKLKFSTDIFHGELLKNALLERTKPLELYCPSGGNLTETMIDTYLSHKYLKVNLMSEAMYKKDCIEIVLKPLI